MPGRWARPLYVCCNCFAVAFLTLHLMPTSWRSRGSQITGLRPTSIVISFASSCWTRLILRRNGNTISKKAVWSRYATNRNLAIRSILCRRFMLFRTLSVLLSASVFHWLTSFLHFKATLDTAWPQSRGSNRFILSGTGCPRLVATGTAQPQEALVVCPTPRVASRHRLRTT